VLRAHTGRMEINDGRGGAVPQPPGVNGSSGDVGRRRLSLDDVVKSCCRLPPQEARQCRVRHAAAGRRRTGGIERAPIELLSRVGESSASHGRACDVDASISEVNAEQQKLNVLGPIFGREHLSN